MSTKRVKKLTASSLRAILATVLILVGSLGVGLFVFGYQQLSDYAKSTDETASKAEQSNHILQDLEKLKDDLSANTDVEQIVSSMIASSADYTYQETIINSVADKARRAGINLNDISFTADTSSTATSQTSVGDAATGTTTTTTAPSGIHTEAAIVTLANPVSYRSLLNFIYSLENGTPSMSIASVTLTKSTTSASMVDCGPLNIKVYVR